jgi:hypothetical protein
VEEMKKLLLVAALGSSGFSFAQVAQVVCVGTEQQCEKSQKKFCAQEARQPAPANLSVAVDEPVTGHVYDQGGNAWIFPGASVLLRTVPGQETIASAAIEKDGRFSLGTVKAGPYRLISVRMVGEVAQRPGATHQPDKLSCEGANACEVKVMLGATPTDQVTDLCPPR